MKNCEHCDKELGRYTGKRKYCSVACKQKAYRDRLKDEKSNSGN